jgi:hypothetical protein
MNDNIFILSDYQFFSSKCDDFQAGSRSLFVSWEFFLFPVSRRFLEFLPEAPVLDFMNQKNFPKKLHRSLKKGSENQFLLSGSNLKSLNKARVENRWKILNFPRNKI